MKQNRTTHKQLPNDEQLTTNLPTHAATSMEARENELISLAYDAAEKRIREGTATSQEIVHFLKLGSSTDRLQKELMESEMKLKDARIQSLESADHLEKIYSDAIEAMKRYSGHEDDNTEG